MTETKLIQRRRERKKIEQQKVLPQRKYRAQT